MSKSQEKGINLITFLFSLIFKFRSSAFKDYTYFSPRIVINGSCLSSFYVFRFSFSGFYMFTHTQKKTTKKQGDKLT